MPSGPDCDEADEECTETETDHLADVPDGAGCVEIWERISDSRNETE
ncbi:hypothetical protein SAMN05216285_0542 [Natrinema salifodinae]|uniref:Uncharacterized protein n=1 Tax=Natrinema salifodinae TaxID=1202768 RepID=A0A1I0M689_9EURY|nr:hypothetical protein SAMN05216285_0542 [Natrinema salifodinae]